MSTNGARDFDAVIVGSGPGGSAVADVLTSQRQWGDMRCRKVLLAVGLQETKPIGSMTERQRLALAARLNAPTNFHPIRPAWEGNGAPQ